jgi:hypothetical protein
VAVSIYDECGHCDAEIAPGESVQDFDPWGQPTGEVFCNNECLTNEGESRDQSTLRGGVMNDTPQDTQQLDLDVVERIAVAYCESDLISIGFLRRIRSLVGRVRELEAENEVLRNPVDRYTENGEPVIRRGWTPVDGGRLDELEAENASLRQTITDIQRSAGQHGAHGQ